MQCLLCRQPQRDARHRRAAADAHRVWATLAALAFATALGAQTPPPAPTPARITQAVNDAQWVRLAGNTLPPALRAADRGAAPAGLALQRMLLVLRRSPGQEADLRQQLNRLRETDSPDYHHWLTPRQFGQRFGPAPADLAAVTAWLRRSGFTVNRVAAGGGVIEFSGTAATVASALHTAIHRYQAQGALHWANAGDPAIPAALAPVVAGVVSLNDFRKPAAAARILGEGAVARTAPGAPTPSLNYGDPSGQLLHALAPADYATIYNLNPLYTAKVDGTGQTIAVVARSDINPADDAAFRRLFLPGATGGFATILDGADPGIVADGDDVEATLDAEWSGAVAPQATVDLVVSQPTDTTDGVDLSALYIVDHDLAPVMTTSFGQCEATMGAAENAFWNALWEQAAAEGITALVSAGDNGPAGCDDPANAAASAGLAVSGLASTPFDTAVGGTQFNEAGNDGAYWNNNTSAGDAYGSALSYIPEQPWNESAVSPGSLASGSGGASALYPKPAWQAGAGVPADQARDLPDVSLSAAGHDGYVICYQNVCDDTSGGFAFHFYTVGGTSASSPSLAGVMALVNQKMSAPQGLANGIFYKLAAQSSCPAGGGTGAGCIFHDVTTGNNLVPCTAGTPDCSTGTLGYSAGPGYDLATGLGSVNADELVNQWGGVAFHASSTTLALTPPANLTHGQSVPMSIQVSGGGGIPGGQVELIAQFADGTEAAVQTFTLDASGSVNASTAALPGGSYNLVARYGGDLNFGSSESAPAAVSVGKESANVNLTLLTLDSNGDPVSATSLIFGQAYLVRAAAAGVSQQGIATGSVTLTTSLNGTTDQSPLTLPLNSQGDAVFVAATPDLQPGVYTLQASYAGDSSLQAASAAPLTVTVKKGGSTTTIAENAPGSNYFTVTISSQIATPIAPDGLYTVWDGANQVGQGGGGDVGTDPKTGYSELVSPVTLPAFDHPQASLTARFGGDVNYAPSVSPVLVIATPTNIALDPASLDFGTVSIGMASSPQTITATNLGGIAASNAPPTIASLNNALPDFFQTSTCPSNLAPGASCQISVVFRPQTAGTRRGSLSMEGPSDTNAVLTGLAPGFQFSQSAPPSATTSAGQPASVSLTLLPLVNFTGPVTLSCSGLPSQAACSFSPAAPVMDGVNPLPITMTISTAANTSKVPAPSGGTGGGVAGLLLLLGGLLLLAIGSLPRRRREALPLALGLAMLAAAGCGGGSSPGPGTGGTGGGGTPQPAATVTPSSVAFGNVAVNATAAQTVTLSNSGSGSLSIYGIGLTPAGGVFSQSNSCPGSLPAGSSCPISLHFAPTTNAVSSATLSIAESADASPQQVNITGTGTYSGTPPGQYPVTVTATAGAEVVQQQVYLTVH